MTINIHNLLEDLHSYIGVETFKPTAHKFEYFDVEYYFDRGHYHRIEAETSLSALNCKELSLLRYFNYLIYVFYRNRQRFQFELERFGSLMSDIQSLDRSRNHFHLAGKIYLRNDYATHGLESGWSGALPHIRLVCLLSATGLFPKLKQRLIDSLIAPIDGFDK